MRLDKHLVHVRIGDVVELDMSSLYTERPVRFAKVTYIQKRFGDSAPLLSITGADGYPWSKHDAESPFIDQSYVKRVISSPKYKSVLKPNLFAVRGWYRNDPCLPSKGIYRCDGVSLIRRIISNSRDVMIETGLDDHKCEKEIQHAQGVVAIHRFGDITVNIKRFKRWVIKNYTRLVVTSKVAHKLALEEDEHWSKLYEEDLKKEWEEDYEDRICRDLCDSEE